MHTDEILVLPAHDFLETFDLKRVLTSVDLPSPDPPTTIMLNSNPRFTARRRS